MDQRQYACPRCKGLSQTAATLQAPARFADLDARWKQGWQHMDLVVAALSKAGPAGDATAINQAIEGVTAAQDPIFAVEQELVLAGIR